MDSTFPSPLVFVESGRPYLLDLLPDPEVVQPLPTPGASGSLNAPSNGSVNTAGAAWAFGTTGESCTLLVYVPKGGATASIAYGIFTPSGRRALVVVNQNTASGLVNIGTYTGGISSVSLSNNNGSTGTLIGIGARSSLA